jgi:pyruvate/2-oxoglutarate dehydrogenase complex dihydrolipoamide acyltransferase (E2) component
MIEQSHAETALIRSPAQRRLDGQALPHRSTRRSRRYADGMPETRGERIIFGIGALAIAALVALIVLQTTDRFETRHTPAARPVTTAAATTGAAAQAPPAPTAPETTTAPDATTGETTAAPEPARIASGVRLTLRAIADTWVEVRSGSADGDVLYSGILQQGSAKRFRSTQLWASFGAASNLTARLNGKSLHLPPGTYSALVGARGLQPLGA